jgi:maltose alpha-D-glucosyltransferase / alpha-amylase
VQLRRFVAATGNHDHVAADTITARTRELAADQLHEIRELGELTGQLHLALAADQSDPNFAPRPLTADQIEHWQNAIRQQRDDIFRDLQRRELPHDQREAVESLLAAGDRIEDRILSLRALADADVVTTRYHGDYHLGQILVSERGFLILDFEGEPLRSLAERRAHHSPLKDVAGMLRSLSYAAETVARDGDHEHAAWWTREWEAQARGAYLDGYIDVTRGAPFIPRDNDALHTAIAVFELEKALYELNYELNNRSRCGGLGGWCDGLTRRRGDAEEIRTLCAAASPR